MKNLSSYFPSVACVWNCDGHQGFSILWYQKFWNFFPRNLASVSELTLGKKKSKSFPIFCTRHHKICQERKMCAPCPPIDRIGLTSSRWSPVYCMDAIYFFSKSKSLLLLLWPRQVWQKYPISSDKGGNFCPFWQVFGQQFSCRTSSRTWFIDQPSTTVCHSYWLVSEFWCCIAAKFFATKTDILFCPHLRPTINTCPCPFHLVHFVASVSKVISYGTLTLTTSIWLISLCRTLWGNGIRDNIPAQWGKLVNLAYL
jgi:hypothetical protein